MKIADLVTIDDKAEFRSDVKLDYYDNPRQNLALVRSYLFSSAVTARGVTAARDRSAIDILRELVNIYRESININRLALIANYGHGKSHLALALANYFGKPADSVELNELYPKIQATLNDKALAALYREFKQNRGEFLIIRLRGDGAGSLHPQFLNGLERGLAEHVATQGTKLPFWYEKATRYLSDLTPEQLEKAKHFLEARSLELPLLLKDIADRKDVFDLAVETIEAATNIRPALSEVSLAEALNWTVSEFVDTGNLGGVLILFDEFSLFIERFGGRSQTAGEIQDLLNGVDNLRGKVAFLALAQADPKTTAENMDSLNSTRRNSLVKSLDRLERKYQLSTVMESVIAAYLKQSPKKWEEFTQSKYVSGPLSSATDAALIHFRQRYENTLRWSQMDFDSVVTKGCFPLHPITTYLLCNMPLGTVSDTSTTRTMLGFVRDFLEEKEPQPAFDEASKRPNWILPVELIDYFEGRFPGKDHVAYEAALRTIGSEATPEEQVVLKALLLQQLANVNPRLLDDQFAYLAQAAGLAEKETKAALRTLSDKGAILWNQKSYSLFPPTANPNILEEILKPHLASLKFNVDSIGALNTFLAEKVIGLTFGGKAIEVGWGHPEDWRAVEHVLTAEGLTPQYLRTIVKTTHFGNHRNDLNEGARSYVFWLLARNDDEVDHMQQNTQAILNEAFPEDWCVPVITILPEKPRPELINLFHRWQGISKLTNEERRKIGPEMLLHAEDRLRGDIKKAMLSIRGDEERPFEIRRETDRYVVPNVYRTRLQILQRPPLLQIVKEGYEWAYPHHPPAFDKRYRTAAQGGTKFKAAITKISGMLLQGSSQRLPEIAVGSDGAMTLDIVNNYLQKSWGLLGRDYSIQIPKAPSIQNAWHYLEKSFVPGEGEKRLSKALIPLLNPPYGFDYNTASLLFSAWIGYNAGDIRLFIGGHQVKIDALVEALSKSTKDFFKQIHENSIRIERRDLNEVEREIRAQLSEYANRHYQQQEAENLVAQFRSFADDQRTDAKLREQLTKAADQLDSNLSAARSYDNAAIKLNQDMQSADLKGQLNLRKQVGALPTLGLVIPVSPPPADIQTAIEQAIKTNVDRAIKEFGHLEDIKSYEWNRKHLEASKNELQKVGLSELVTKLDRALSDLETRQQVLQTQATEKPIRDMIVAMRANRPLAILYDQHQQLTDLSGYSDEIIKLRDGKLNEIKAEISKLEKEAREFTPRILSHTSTSALDKDRENLMRVNYLYDSTPLAQELESANQLIRKYALFLEELGNIGANIQFLKGVDDAEQLRFALDRSEIENDDWLGENQRQLISRARKKIDDQEASAKAKATQWINRLVQESQSNGSNPVKLLEETQNKPPFLSFEQETQLQSIIHHLEHQIDQDVVAQIEREFRKIRDPHKRQECVQRLQQLLNEVQTEDVGQKVRF